MFRIVISPRARLDLEQIWRFHSDVGIPVADRVTRRIVDGWSRLQDFPKSSVSVPGLSGELRRVVTGNYVSFIQIAENDVIVRRVLHGKRDLSKLLADDDQS